jgi:hypothetical protein
MNDNIIKLIAETYRKMQLNEHIPLDDQEGGMVQSQMKSIIEKANDILGMMKGQRLTIMLKLDFWCCLS